MGISVSLFLCAGALHAQQGDKQDPRSVNPINPLPPSDAGATANFGGKPVPAARGVSTPYSPQSYDPAQAEPDTNTLSGAEVFGVGSLTHSRNVFDPLVSVTVLGQTMPVGTGTQTQLGPGAILGGSLLFNRVWSRYQFIAIYNGGDNISDNARDKGQFHDLTVEQEVEWERWRLRLRDEFLTAPGSSFGGAGMGGPGLIGQFSGVQGVALNTIAQQFIPADTIQTVQTRRDRNMALGEAEYSFSRRSAFTVGGSYGILNFKGTDYVSSHLINLQGGYDYQLDPVNSIALIGGYGKIDFVGSPILTTDYMLSLAYGRRIFDRLSFQIAAGPQRIVVAGTSTGNFEHWIGSVNSAMTWDIRRSGFVFLYTRGVTGGSGVFYGAVTNTVTLLARHHFSRFWEGTVNGAYSLNTGLVPAGSTASSFTNWVIGGNVSRQLGRSAQLGFNYGIQKQDNPALCPVANCGVAGYQQTIGMTVHWHLRPIE